MLRLFVPTIAWIGCAAVIGTAAIGAEPPEQRERAKLLEWSRLARENLSPCNPRHSPAFIIYTVLCLGYRHEFVLVWSEEEPRPPGEARHPLQLPWRELLNLEPSGSEER